MYYQDIEFDIIRKELENVNCWASWWNVQCGPFINDIRQITERRYPYIQVYLSDYEIAEKGYNLVLDFYTYLDYFAFYQYMGKTPEPMPFENPKSPRLSTFFYISSFMSEDVPIKGHYRLDLNVLSSNWRESQHQEDGDGDVEIISRPPYFLAYFEKNNENNKNGDRLLPDPLLHYIGNLAYPQWVFSCLMKKPTLNKVGKANFELRVNNVEQGNWNEIRKDGKSYLMFDIGTNAYKRDSLKDIDRQLRNHPITDDVEALFISHWHADHFNIMLGMNLSEHDHIKYLICPSFVMSLSAFNIICWYKLSGRAVTTINHPYRKNWKLYPIHDRVNLYARRYVKTNPNNAGLLLYFDGVNNSVTLSGDANYSSAKEITDDAIVHFKSRGGYYLVVPHHGGDAGSCQYNISTSATKIDAFFSYGVGNPYNHPYEKVLNSLKGDFHIYKTPNALLFDRHL